MQMTVLDVGQGTAVVLRTRQQVVVYDTGRALGGRIIADHLRGMGIKRIDKLIISHDDYDHRGGMDILLDDVAAESVIASDGDTRCERGLQWRDDGVSFTALHPPPGAARASNHNDHSCVILVENAAGKRALLTGDISAAVEHRITARADVLLAAHHGSRHSTGAAFLQTVRPDYAIIPVGRNRYGHPHPQTLQRLQDAGVTVFNTQDDGAVLVYFNDAVDLSSWRKTRQRYWR